jgi:WD domain, G-beta repeat
MSRVRKKKLDRVSQLSPSVKKKSKTVDLGWKGDENIESEDEEEHQHRMGEPMDDESVEEEEALDAKRVRLARQYLEKLEGDSSNSSSEEESDHHEDGSDGANADRIGTKLQRERLKREGVLERAVADKVATGLEKIRRSLPSSKNQSATLDARAQQKEWVDCGHLKLMRGHDLTPTCVALQSDGLTAISGSKDHSVLIWDVENEKRSQTLCPIWKKNQAQGVSRTLGEVLSVACSDDGRYAAIGKRDATVSIFDIRAGKNSLVKTFDGHKGAITCLSFRTQSLQLFSGSEDRCIR